MKTLNKDIALVFDLGNVLLPIDLNLTYQAFASFSTKFQAEDIKYQIEKQSLWYKYEKGLMNDAEFRKFLKKELFLECTDVEFDQAFNSLLINVPEDSLFLMNSLRNEFDFIYLLSNTSKIHADLYRKKEFSDNLFLNFNKLFLSFEIQEIKPEKQIYEYLSQKIEKKFEEIIFFDDNFANIEMAKSLGIQAHLVDPLNRIEPIITVNNNYIHA